MPTLSRQKPGGGSAGGDDGGGSDAASPDSDPGAGKNSDHPGAGKAPPEGSDGNATRHDADDEGGRGDDPASASPGDDGARPESDPGARKTPEGSDGKGDGDDDDSDGEYYYDDGTRVPSPSRPRGGAGGGGKAADDDDDESDSEDDGKAINDDGESVDDEDLTLEELGKRKRARASPGKAEKGKPSRTTPKKKRRKSQTGRAEVPWEEHLAQLTAFKAENDHTFPARSTKLGRWADVQRSKKKSGALPPDKVQKLNEMGFVWGKPRSRPQENVGWDGRCDQLAEYKEAHGHVDVPTARDGPHARLNAWVHDQRRAKRLGKLSDERAARLDALGFRWERAPRAAGGASARASGGSDAVGPRWEGRFEELRRYKEEHGDFGANGSTPLGTWVSNQRSAKRRGRLSLEKAARLDAIGFNWACSTRKFPGGRFTWDERLEQLRKHKEEHGTFDAEGDASLNNWANRHRQLRRNGHLPDDDEKFKRLDALGFDWDGAGQVRPYVKRSVAVAERFSWDERLDQLRSHKEEHGNFDAEGEEGLGGWAKKQRQLRKNGRLPDDHERFRRLDALGFNWDGATPARKRAWGRKIDLRVMASPGKVGLKVAFDGEGGAVVTGVHPRGPLGGRVRVGDRLLTVDGQRVGRERDLERGDDGNDALREYGFATAKDDADEDKGGIKGFAIDLRLAVSPGRVGLTVAFEDDEAGALVTAVHSECALAGRVRVGDRLIEIEGEQVTATEDLTQGNDQPRQFGFATASATEEGMGEEDVVGNDGDGSSVGGLTCEVVKKREGKPTKERKRRSMTQDDINKWEARFKELLAYIEEHGHCQVAQREGGLGKWVKNQRYKKQKGTVPEDLVRRLEAVGFTWTCERPKSEQSKGARKQPRDPATPRSSAFHDAQWEEKFEHLRQFGLANGHLRPHISSDPMLRKWVDRQRLAHKAGKLTEERSARLRSIGFELGAVQTGFLSLQERLFQLGEYLAQHGHCNVPLSHPVLGKWVWNQRNEYKKMNLSDDRVRALEAAYFDWQLTFEERLSQLREYSLQHGNSNPPPTHVYLGDWVQGLRRAYRNNQLPQEHAVVLEGAGFLWSTAPPKRMVGWDLQHELLQRYHAEHGHCNVPRSHPQLGCWIDNQRRAAKKGKMPPERVDALNALGFNWGATRKDNDVSWQDQYDELLAYKAAHGNCNVSQREETGLGRFVKWQRYIRKKGKLSAERIKLLDDIDFNWGSLTPRAPPMGWDARFEMLQKYKEEHGHVNITTKEKADNDGLWQWLKNQRYEENFEKLPDERKNKLIEMGVTPIGNMRADAWEAQYLKLSAYREEHGNCNATGSMEPSLVSWAVHQRRKYAAGELSEERVAQLTLIEFSFDRRAVVDFHLPVSVGPLGLKFEMSDKIVGAKITAIDPTSILKDHIGVGDRLVTIDGRLIATHDDLTMDDDGILGVVKAKKRVSPVKKSTRKTPKKKKKKGGNKLEISF